jgi:hypothetical protein
MADLPRRADPYDDTDVIDERAPRFNQAFVAAMALAGVVAGWPLLWALMAFQFVLGLTLGRRWCVACVFYFEVIQPRFGEGSLEDSRAPRLANIMGMVFLGAAAISWWAGAETLGIVLGSLVAALALLASATGFCAGCEIYRLLARLRGVSPRHQDRIDPVDLGGFNGASRTIVQFSHPLCTDCREWSERLAGAPEPLVEVDVSSRPELARKYGVAIVPTVVAVAPDGEVVERLA